MASVCENQQQRKRNARHYVTKKINSAIISKKKKHRLTKTRLKWKFESASFPESIKMPKLLLPSNLLPQQRTPTTTLKKMISSSSSSASSRQYTIISSSSLGCRRLILLLIVASLFLISLQQQASKVVASPLSLPSGTDPFFPAVQQQQQRPSSVTIGEWTHQNPNHQNPPPPVDASITRPPPLSTPLIASGIDDDNSQQRSNQQGRIRQYGLLHQQMRTSLNPTVHNLQYGAEFDLRFVGYSNPRLEMKDGRTCTCRYQDSYRCTYMRYEAFPCRFSFTVVVAPLDQLVYHSTDFLPVNETGLMASADGGMGGDPLSESWSQPIHFSLTSKPRFINIIVHNLGLVIDRSDQRLIYKDYLYPVDSFTIDLNERATPTAFGEPRSYETLTAVGEWARSELQIRLAIQCNPEFVGPLCEFKRDLCSLPSAAIGRNNHLLAPTTATPFASSFFSPIQIQRSPSSNLLLNSNFAASVPQQQQLDAAVKPRDSTNQQDSSTFLTSYSSSSSLIKDHSFNKQKTAAAAAENQNKKLLNDELLQQQQKAVVCFSHLPSLKDVPFGCLFNFNTAAASGGGGVGRGEIHNSCQVCRYGHRDGHCVNDLAQWQQLDQKKGVEPIFRTLTIIFAVLFAIVLIVLAILCVLCLAVNSSRKRTRKKKASPSSAPNYLRAPSYGIVGYETGGFQGSRFSPAAAVPPPLLHRNGGGIPHGAGAGGATSISRFPPQPPLHPPTSSQQQQQTTASHLPLPPQHPGMISINEEELLKRSQQPWETEDFPRIPRAGSSSRKEAQV